MPPDSPQFEPHPLLSALDEDSLAALLGALEPFILPVDEKLAPGEADERALLLLDRGRVRLACPAPETSGSGEFFTERCAGDLFGEELLFGGEGDPLPEAVALEEVQGRRLSEEALGKLAGDFPRLLPALRRAVFLHRRRADLARLGELERSVAAAESTLTQLRALGSTSMVLNSTLDLDTLLRLILDEATRNTGADKGTIYLLDEEQEELYSRVLGGSGSIEEIRLPVGVGLAGYVAATGQTVNIEDAYADERFNPEVDRLTGYHTKSVLTVPMLAPDRRIVGVLQVINKPEGRFTGEDEQFVRAMGTHASIAIEKARLAETMVRQESLAAIGRLAATIIHDIKNPMSVIRGYAQLVEEMTPDESARSYIRIIESQIDRMIGMTREILDFSRGTLTVNFAPVDPSELLSEVEELLRPDLEERNIRLETRWDGERRPVKVDRGKVVRILVNLIGNARDAMPDGGTITVEARDEGEHWTLTVRDTGTGIPPERLQTIFEPFVTFDKTHGTGLGLAITKQLVQAHGGTIEVASDPGTGTTFTLRFPREPRPPQA